MVRITGGSLRGRRVAVPRGNVRPTQDRVREALFSMLAPRLAGAAFLDLYAGSGAVGIEAWSRGAGDVTWVESSRRVLPVLRHNVDDLCGGEGRVMPIDVLRYVRGGGDGSFDIVFADPPYERNPGTAGTPLLERLLHVVGEGSMLNPDGCVVLEHAAGSPPAAPAGWTGYDARTYGDAALSFFSRGRI